MCQSRAVYSPSSQGLGFQQRNQQGMVGSQVKTLKLLGREGGGVVMLSIMIWYECI